MATSRATILAALKTLLVNGVSAVAGKVYLPWDDQPELSNAPLLQLEIADTTIDPDQIIGQWEHTVAVNIGAVKTGKFDYSTTWDILGAAAAAINSNPTLNGTVNRIEITGAADSVTVAGDKVLWPHLQAVIVYRTTKGTL